MREMLLKLLCVGDIIIGITNKNNNSFNLSLLKVVELPHINPINGFEEIEFKFSLVRSTSLVNIHNIYEYNGELYYSNYCMCPESDVLKGHLKTVIESYQFKNFKKNIYDKARLH